MKKTNIIRLMATCSLAGLLSFAFLALHSEKGITVHAKLRRGTTKSLCYCLEGECVSGSDGTSDCSNSLPCDTGQCTEGII